MHVAVPSFTRKNGFDQALTSPYVHHTMREENKGRVWKDVAFTRAGTDVTMVAGQRAQKQLKVDYPGNLKNSLHLVCPPLPSKRR